MEQFISFFAAFLSLISLGVACLAYLYSKDIRGESSQLRLVDKTGYAYSLVKNNIYLVKCLTKNIESYEMKISKAPEVTEHVKLIAAEINDVNTCLLDLEIELNEVMGTLSDPSLRRVKNSTDRFYKLYVKVSKICILLEVYHSQLSEFSNQLSLAKEQYDKSHITNASTRFTTFGAFSLPSVSRFKASILGMFTQ